MIAASMRLFTLGALAAFALLTAAACAVPPQEASVSPTIDSAKVSPSLLALYDAHRTAEAQRAPEEPVPTNYVRVEAMAEREPEALLANLSELGLTEGAQAGVVINGRLPVAALPEASHLPRLRYIDAVRQPPRTPVEPPERGGGSPELPD